MILAPHLTLLRESSPAYQARNDRTVEPEPSDTDALEALGFEIVTLAAHIHAATQRLVGACPSERVGRARGAFACSAKKRRRGVAALRRGEATMDQPRTHHVPVRMQHRGVKDCGLGAARPRLRRWRSST